MEALVKEALPWAQTLAPVVAVVALFFVWLQLRAQTQDRIYAHYTEICKLFIQNPELQPYFYRLPKAAPPKRTEEDKKLAPKVDFMCEALLGLIEHAVLQRSYMPKECWHNCWHPYAVQRLEESPAMQKFWGAIIFHTPYVIRHMEYGIWNSD